MQRVRATVTFMDVAAHVYPVFRHPGAPYTSIPLRSAVPCVHPKVDVYVEIHHLYETVAMHVRVTFEGLDEKPREIRRTEPIQVVGCGSYTDVLFTLEDFVMPDHGIYTFTVIAGESKVVKWRGFRA